MNHNSPHRCWGRLIALLPALVLVIAGLACPAGSFGAPTPQQQSSTLYPTDALIFVISNPAGDDAVSLAYTSEVPSEQVKADLAELQRASGWKLNDVKSDAKSPGGGAPPTTGVTFTTRGPVDYQSGYLNVEPFVMALKRLRRINIQFLIPGGFDFRGLQDFHNDAVNVKYSKNGIAHVYFIELAKNDFQSLDLPRPRNNRVLLWIGIVILAAIAAAAAYWVSSRYIKSRSE